MHPFTPKGKIMYKGLEGFEASSNMLSLCQPYLNQPIYHKQSILRPCHLDEDFARWKDTATQYPEVLLALYICT